MSSSTAQTTRRGNSGFFQPRYKGVNNGATSETKLSLPGVPILSSIWALSVTATIAEVKGAIASSSNVRYYTTPTTRAKNTEKSPRFMTTAVSNSVKDVMKEAEDTNTYEGDNPFLKIENMILALLLVISDILLMMVAA